MREEMERLGHEITEKKVSLASLEEKRKGMESHRIRLTETQRTLKEQILKRVRAVREGRERDTSLLGRRIRAEENLT